MQARCLSRLMKCAKHTPCVTAQSRHATSFSIPPGTPTIACKWHKVAPFRHSQGPTYRARNGYLGLNYNARGSVSGDAGTGPSASVRSQHVCARMKMPGVSHPGVPRRFQQSVQRVRAISQHIQASAAIVDERPAVGYQRPPQSILDIIDRPQQPGLSISPDKKKVLQLYRPPPYPPIQELARPELKIAGIRIDTEINAGSRMGHNLGMGVLDFTDDLVLPAPEEKELKIHGYPEGSWINLISWSDDSKFVAFTVRSPGGALDSPRMPLELWVAETVTGKAKKLLDSPNQGLNCTMDNYSWLDSDTIIANVIPEGRGPPPIRPLAPIGPRIEDNSLGKQSQARTYQDLLKDGHDEDLFDYYCTSELLYIKVSTGEVTKFAPPRVYTSIEPSPDAEYMLVSWLQRPYSFSVPCGRFPRVTQLWDRHGKCVKEMCSLPLADDIPITFNSVRKGMRSLDWRDDKAAELSWIETQDGGDAKVEVSPRDIVYTLSAEDANNAVEPKVLATTDLRCGGVQWGDGNLALLYESWYDTRKSIIYTIAPDRPDEPKKILFDRNYEDSYSDPGSPVTRKNKWGMYVLAQLDNQRKLLLEGSGASSEGNRPFIDILDIDTKETQRVWQSTPPYLESPGLLLNDSDVDAPISADKLVMLITREQMREQPQYFIKTLSANSTNGSQPSDRQLSNFPHPYPSIRDLQREVIRYKREDGVDLTATLYLPPGYNKDTDGRLPCILWAYPREFKSRDAAGQMRRSPHQFSSIGGSSPQLFLAEGFAILDGPTLPIIAEGDEEPNDTYMAQLIAGAKAAVKEVVSRGVVDPAKVAVGGHSYGAFMAANLLAGDTEGLFACGIAQSGAYNRTLTPFGFQSEQRTLWQAPETYHAMSPFLQADKIKKPLLLIHGADDSNSGTFPLQSERFYAALKGHGAVTRLVILPHESHGYRSRESTLHVLAEQFSWLKKHCLDQSPNNGSNGTGEAKSEKSQAMGLAAASA